MSARKKTGGQVVVDPVTPFFPVNILNWKSDGCAVDFTRCTQLARYDSCCLSPFPWLVWPVGDFESSPQSAP